MHTSSRRARTRGRSVAAHVALTAVIAALAALAALAACADPAAPDALGTHPAPSASVAAASSLGIRGYALGVHPVDGDSSVLTTSAYNAAAGDVLSWSTPITGDTRLTFLSLARVLVGTPHAQVTPVRLDGNGTGRDVCTIGTSVSGQDVEVSILCQRNGRDERMLQHSQLFDHASAAAFATVDAQGVARNARRFARIERPTAGRTRVYFTRAPLFGGDAKPIAFVTPRRSSGHGDQGSCQLLSIGSRHERPDELGVEVDCHDASGRRANLPFDVIAMAQTARAGYAFIGDGARIVPEHSHAPQGTIHARRVATGHFQVSFDGVARGWTDDGTVMLSTHGAAGERCVVDDWSRIRSVGRVRVDVQCRGVSGALTDARFVVLVTTRD